MSSTTQFDSAFKHIDAETLASLGRHQFRLHGPFWVSRLKSSDGAPFVLPTEFEPSPSAGLLLVDARRWSFLLTSTLLDDALMVATENEAATILLDALAEHDSGM